MWQISSITLGTAQLGLDYGVANKEGLLDQESSMELLQLAVDTGINTVDTSPVYGFGEAIIGRFIREQPSVLQIATKLPTLPGDGKLSDETLAIEVQRCLHRSLEALGRSHIEYYLIHDQRDFIRYHERLLEVLFALKAQGIIGQLGISLYSPELALESIAAGVQAIQIPCNLFDDRFAARGVLSLAEEKGVTVFTRSIYLQGLFFLRGADVACWLPQAVPWLERLRDTTQRLARGIDELALVYVRDIGKVDSLVIGMESPAQLERNRTLVQCPPLSSEERQELTETFAAVPEEIVNPFLWKRTK